MFKNGSGVYPAKIMSLASGENGQGNLLRLGGCKHEQHMGRWLFKRFQQSIKGCCREHVDFINDVNFVAAVGRHVPDIIPDIADLIHTVVGCSVNFKDIDRLTRGDLDARTAYITWGDCRTLLAIQRFGQNAGNGGFACSPWPGKQNGMGHPSGGDGMA